VTDLSALASGIICEISHIAFLFFPFLNSISFYQGLYHHPFYAFLAFYFYLYAKMALSDDFIHPIAPLLTA